MKKTMKVCLLGAVVVVAAISTVQWRRLHYRNHAKVDKTTVTINVDGGKEIISRHIYGHFSEHLGRCIYDGLWVGEDSSIPNINGVRKDIIDAMKQIKIPNLRWPGGCFADEYHWKDGIGPRASRPSMVNTNWGGVTEDNSFGTHEFLNMCEEIGTEPYISANVGSSTVQEIAQWIEYMTFDGESPMTKLRKENGREKPWNVKFLGVGNETWGCGGNMTAEHYSDVYRQFATYCKNYGDNRLFKIAVGPSSDDYNWMDVVMKNVGRQANGVSLHHYSVPSWQGSKGSATEFGEKDYYNIISMAYKMEELVTEHSAIMDKYDPDKNIGLMVDEWGSWYDVEPGTNPSFLYQQNTMRDAILAGMTLNIFNNHCDRVRMANIAQVVNVLQALFLTEGEKMIKTPTFYIFDMYKVHQDATMLPVTVRTNFLPYEDRTQPQLSVSASKDADGLIHISLVNTDLKEELEIACTLNSSARLAKNGGEIITSENIQDHNTFDNPDVITSKNFDDYSVEDNTLTLKVPAKSVITLCLK